MDSSHLFRHRLNHCELAVKEIGETLLQRVGLGKGTSFQRFAITDLCIYHHGDDLEMICAVLRAGLYPNAIQCKRRGKRTAFCSKDVGKVDIHPSSAIMLEPPSFLCLTLYIYSEKLKTTSTFVRDSTNISDYALLLFGGSLVPSKTGVGIEMLGYLHFPAPKRVFRTDSGNKGLSNHSGSITCLCRRTIRQMDSVSHWVSSFESHAPPDELYVMKFPVHETSAPAGPFKTLKYELISFTD